MVAHPDPVIFLLKINNSRHVCKFLYMMFGINIVVDVIKIIGATNSFEVNERYKLERRFDKHYHM